uniref:C2H2-type domain-containing protein n=1 Tax=Xiphophorus maculatus TaxID=8083 RepID=A0A3B5QRX6_XIPMA
TLHPSTSTVATSEQETSALTPNTPRIHLTTSLYLEPHSTQGVGLKSTRRSEVQTRCKEQQLVVKEEVPEMSSSSLDQQNLTCSQVKKEEEEQWIKPDREPDPNTNLQPNIEDRHSASSETEVSDEDSAEDWREPRTRQSGVNSKVGRKAAKKTFSCPDCGKHCSIEKNHSRGKQNSDAQMERKSFSCDDCGKIFQNQAALKCHMRIHRSKKSVVCKDCGKSFHCQFQLKNHLTLHTGERPFACDKCGKTFRLRHTLKIHMICHTEEKPFNVASGRGNFACEECGRRFLISAFPVWTSRTSHVPR